MSRVKKHKGVLLSLLSFAVFFVAYQLTIVQPTAQQLATLRTILNDVWDRQNHRLVLTSGVGAQGALETEITIFNDVWDKAQHSLKTDAATSSVSAFTGLNDAPTSYAGQGGKAVVVKSDVSGLEFVDFPTPGSGTVTSSDSPAANDLAVFTTGTNITKLTPGTGVATFLGTPSSANLASAVTGETGTGALVFGTSPAFTTQITVPKVNVGTAAVIEDLTAGIYSRKTVGVSLLYATGHMFIQDVAGGGAIMALISGAGGLQMYGAGSATPTGGDKGIGTINTANGYYDNNVRIKTVLSGTSASIGGGALLAGACASDTVTVTGAATGMAVETTPTTYPGDGTLWQAYISAADTVTVKVCAVIAITPTSSTYNVRVLQ